MSLSYDKVKPGVFSFFSPFYSLEVPCVDPSRDYLLNHDKQNPVKKYELERVYNPLHTETDNGTYTGPSVIIILSRNVLNHNREKYRSAVSLMDLYGLAPDMIGDEDPVEYVRKVRDMGDKGILR